MNTVYLSYLRLVILVAACAALTAVLLFVVIKSKRRRDLNTNHQKCGRGVSSAQTQVDSGNVSVFFDKRRNSVLIPYVSDKYRSGKATADIIWLDMPYKSEVLGSEVKAAMASCKKGEPADNTELMSKLGSRGWKEFTEGKLSVSVYYKENRGILMNSTVRMPDGAYVFTTRGPELCLPPDADDARLGEAILELLKKCR